MHTVISLVSVEAQREAVDIPGGVGAPTRAGNGGEPQENGGLLARLGEERSSSVVGPIPIRLKVTVCCRSSGMNYTMRGQQWVGVVHDMSLACHVPARSGMRS